MNYRYKKTSPLQKGFTLLEVILAVFLFSAIVALVAGFSVYYFKNYSFSFEEAQVVGQAQTTLTQMMRDIRKARNGDDGSWPLILANDNEFIFYSDVTGDGRTDRLRYFLQGTNLRRGIIQPTLVPVTYPLGSEVVTTVATNLVATTSAIFQYYDGNWPQDKINNPLAPSSRILNTRFVRATIRLNPSDNFAAQPFDLTSGVTIRSMKTNL